MKCSQTKAKIVIKLLRLRQIFGTHSGSLTQPVRKYEENVKNICHHSIWVLSPAGEELLTFEAFPIFPAPRHSIRLSEVDLKKIHINKKRVKRWLEV